MTDYFRVLTAAAVLVPSSLAAGYAVGQRGDSSVLDGLSKVSTEEHYGWVVLSGKFKGQTTDPAVVLQYPKEDRPPAEFRKVSCSVYGTRPLALSSQAVQVCSAVPVPEAEVREALKPVPAS